MKPGGKALLLAPALVPSLCSLLLVADSGGGNPVFGFLFLFALGSVISYGATIALLQPALAIASRFTALDLPKVAALGLLLGLVVFMPLAWVSWRASGPDSGPPLDSFFAHFMRDLADPLMLVFPLGGLVTAALYWSLGGHAQQDQAKDRHG